MAIHRNPQSMLRESLVEMYLVAKYCIIEVEKDTNIWPAPGCYGYPGALLLLSIADAVGSYVIDKKTVRSHFDILKHIDYYDLQVSDSNITAIYKKYRNLLNHNSVLAMEAVLDIGNTNDSVFEIKDNRPYLNLVPFLEKTKKVLIKFLSNSNQIVTNSKQLQNILKK